MISMIFISFLVMLILAVPVPAAIGVSTVTGLFAGNLNMGIAISGVTRMINSFTLLAIPFFVLCGNIMSKGSIARKLLNVCQAFAGKSKTAMGLTTILCCTFFAALSGSSVATVAAIGAITIPMMYDVGYNKAFAPSIAASGAIVGPIIPPSIPFVVYGISTNTSISDLFLAGAIPGLMLSAVFALCVIFMAEKNIDAEVAERATAKVANYTWKQKMDVLWDAKWALMMPVIVLGGIYGGIVTPTEAAIISCDYALFVGVFIDRDLTWAGFWEASKSTIKTSGSLLLLIGVAQAFGYVITLNQIPKLIVAMVQSITTNPYILLLLLNIFLLIVGCFMELQAAIVILTPVLLPLAKAGGLDALQFGVIMSVNLVIGMLTPPFGLNVFVGASLSKVPVHIIFKKCMPFTVSAIIVLMIITYIPGIISFLPNLLR